MTQSKMLNYLTGTTSKVEILRTLFENGIPMTGRRIASTAGISPRSCQLSLDALVKVNALHRKAMGRAFTYSLNADHRAINDLLRPLFLAEAQVARDAAQAILKHVRSISQEIAAIFWRIERVKKSETLHYVVVVKNRKNVLGSDIVAKVEQAVVAQWGFPVKAEAVTTTEFAGSYLPTEDARKRFAAGFAKLKGASFEELVGAPKRKKATR